MFNTLRKLWSELGADERSYLKTGLILIAALGAIFIFVFPLVLTRASFFPSYSETGAIGDTINGISGPFIALLAAALTFLAFYIQYKANIQQRDNFKKEMNAQKKSTRTQENVWRIERFESRLYELLTIHRANVDEMNIADRFKGRKCFVQMFSELRFCYKIFEGYLKEASEDLQIANGYNKIDLMRLSYDVFFYGIDRNSEKRFVKKLNSGELHLYNVVRPFFDQLQDQVLKTFEDPTCRYHVHTIETPNYTDDSVIEFYYMPFDGHLNRLGHYYRHLFQMTEYVKRQRFAEPTTYDYLKMVRAQLSSYEQLLLYYNALAWFDKEWRESFTKYRLIKNLPLDLADFDKLPEVNFSTEIANLASNGEVMFEDHEAS